jgi:hypothetical protein
MKFSVVTAIADAGDDTKLNVRAMVTIRIGNSRVIFIKHLLNYSLKQRYRRFNSGQYNLPAP